MLVVGVVMRLLILVLFLDPVSVVEEGLLVKPVNFLLIILWIQLILEIDLMLRLVILLDPPLTDDLLHRAHLLLQRSWL